MTSQHPRSGERAGDGVVARGYDRAASEYAALDEDGSWPREGWLERLTARLEPGARVLDLGCATGVPVAARLAQAHLVTGVDVSPEQIRTARAKVPSAEFVCGSATDVDFPEGRFDAVVSLYTFDHIPRDRHAELLERVRGWLRPGGWLLLSIEDADQPGTTATWLGVDMFFSMFDAEATRDLVRQAGFDIEETAVEPQFEQGAEVRYTWILARTPS